MPDFTNSTIQPHVARVLLQAEGHEMIPADIKARLQNELALTESDRLVDDSGEPHWWHRALSAINYKGKGGLQTRGIVVLAKKNKRSVWRLTDPTGVAWARETVVLHWDQMKQQLDPSTREAIEKQHAPGSSDEDYLPYQPDSRVRIAVEVRALELAEEKYIDGYKIRPVGKPYDLECVHKKTGKHRHIEVKGFQDEDPPVVIVTGGEVEHVRKREFPVDLVVATGIGIRAEGEKRKGIGGRIKHHLRNWQPKENDLRITRYNYKLPRKVTTL